MASKRTHDFHARLTDEEREMGEAYAKILKEENGVQSTWTNAFRALARLGFISVKEARKRKRKAT